MAFIEFLDDTVYFSLEDSLSLQHTVEATGFYLHSLTLSPRKVFLCDCFVGTLVIFIQMMSCM